MTESNENQSNVLSRFWVAEKERIRDTAHVVGNVIIGGKPENSESEQIETGLVAIGFITLWAGIFGYLSLTDTKLTFIPVVVGTEVITSIVCTYFDIRNNILDE